MNEGIKEVFIHGNVPSSKNSKQVATLKNGRTIVTHSKTVQKYLRLLGIQHYSVTKKEFTLYKTKPFTFPVEDLKKLFNDGKSVHLVGFHFIRGTKHKADFHNLVQIMADLFVAFDIIEDDDMSRFLPTPLIVDGQYYSYNKENPGVVIKVIESQLI